MDKKIKLEKKTKNSTDEEKNDEDKRGKKMLVTKWLFIKKQLNNIEEIIERNEYISEKDETEPQ